jgi:hypothetical protein
MGWVKHLPATLQLDIPGEREERAHLILFQCDPVLIMQHIIIKRNTLMAYHNIFVESPYGSFR